MSEDSVSTLVWHADMEGVQESQGAEWELQRTEEDTNEVQNKGKEGDVPRAYNPSTWKVRTQPGW